MRPNRYLDPIPLEPRRHSLWTADDLGRVADEERRLRRSMHHVLAVGGLVLVGLVLTTLVGEALEYRNSPLDLVRPAPARSA